MSRRRDFDQEGVQHAGAKMLMMVELKHLLKISQVTGHRLSLYNDYIPFFPLENILIKYGGSLMP